MYRKMYKKMCDRKPIFCVVPPYMLDAIARNGTPQQRTAALRTKAVDNTSCPQGRHPTHAIRSGQERIAGAFGARD